MVLFRGIRKRISTKNHSSRKEIIGIYLIQIGCLIIVSLISLTVGAYNKIFNKDKIHHRNLGDFDFFNN